MNRDYILSRLKEHKNYIKEYYGFTESEIFGIFAFGSMNYGIHLEDSDIDSKMIIIPSKEEMLLMDKPTRTSVEIKDGKCKNGKEYCTIIDIRFILKELLTGNFSSYEILSNNYFIISEIFYLEQYDEIINIIRQLFYSRDENNMLYQFTGRISEALYNKDDYNAYRLYLSLNNYMERLSIQRVFNFCNQPNLDNLKKLINLKTRKEKLTSLEKDFIRLYVENTRKSIKENKEISSYSSKEVQKYTRKIINIIKNIVLK